MSIGFAASPIANIGYRTIPVGACGIPPGRQPSSAITPSFGTLGVHSQILETIHVVGVDSFRGITSLVAHASPRRHLFVASAEASESLNHSRHVGRNSRRLGLSLRAFKLVSLFKQPAPSKRGEYAGCQVLGMCSRAWQGHAASSSKPSRATLSLESPTPLFSMQPNSCPQLASRCKQMQAESHILVDQTPETMQPSVLLTSNCLLSDLRATHCLCGEPAHSPDSQLSAAKSGLWKSVAPLVIGSQNSALSRLSAVPVEKMSSACKNSGPTTTPSLSSDAVTCCGDRKDVCSWACLQMLCSLLYGLRATYIFSEAILPTMNPMCAVAEVHLHVACFCTS